MSKYKCNKCGQNAHHIDFLNNDTERFISAVYVYCLNCKINAWGGVNFHPEMNELLNTSFSPNFDYNPSESNEEYVLVKLTESD